MNRLTTSTLALIVAASGAVAQSDEETTGSSLGNDGQMDQSARDERRQHRHQPVRQRR